MKFILSFLLILIVLVNNSKTQSRCDTICGINLECNQGICYLSKCSDITSCFSFCFICNGIEKCYATGPTCSYSSATLLSYSHSSKILFKTYYYTYSISLFLIVFSL
jgi:hypothetical protein